MTTSATLADTIEVLRRRIHQIRERKEIIGEENTKATLIEPLLAALGWDLHDLDEVRREYRRKPQDNPVDYALFLNRTACLFIEAKSLEKDLADRKWAVQNLNYATTAGVQWCVLTNGDEYRIYNAHAPVPAEEKWFRTVRISDSEVKDLVDTLSLLSKEKMRSSLLEELWKRHYVDQRVHQALANLLAEQDSRLVNAIRKKAGALSPAHIRASLKRARISIDFPLTPSTPPPASRREPSKKIRETTSAAKPSLADLIAAGLIQLPLQIEREYKGHHLVAVIRQDGKVEFAGEQYGSLSTAGAMARKTVIGSPANRPYPQTDGWTFWRYRDKETGELRQMDCLREIYLANRK